MSAVEVDVAPLNLARRVDEAVAVEAAAFGRPPDRFRRDSYVRHSTYTGFAALGALHGDRLVGFGYGHTDEPGQWWHDQVVRPLLAAGHGGWLDSAFVLVELHVHPQFQQRGIGRALLTELLAGRREARALLSAHDEQTPARNLYRRQGFVDLLTDFRFVGTARPFVVMGAHLPLGQAS